MGDTGLIPGSGKIPHAVGQLEPVFCNQRSGCHEKPVHNNEEWPLLATIGESLRAAMETQCRSPPKIEKQWVAIANSKLDSFVIKDFTGTTGETWMQPEDLVGKYHSWHGSSDVDGWLCRGLSCCAGNIKYLRVITHQVGKHPQMVFQGKFFLL